jgi:ferrous-iron efflux pump FieF
MLVLFQRQVLRRIPSLAVGADKLHYTGDLLMNVSVIVSLVISTQFGWPYADPLFAMGIALFLLWSGGSIGWHSYKQLMDQEFPENDRQRIERICIAHPDVRAVHDLRTRSAGIQSFIQLHLELDGGLTLRQAHDISDTVEASIRNAFPTADVTIHADPTELEEIRAVFD